MLILLSFNLISAENIVSIPKNQKKPLNVYRTQWFVTDSFSPALRQPFLGDLLAN